MEVESPVIFWGDTWTPKKHWYIYCQGYTRENPRDVDIIYIYCTYIYICIYIYISALYIPQTQSRKNISLKLIVLQAVLLCHPVIVAFTTKLHKDLHPSDSPLCGRVEPLSGTSWHHWRRFRPFVGGPFRRFSWFVWLQVKQGISQELSTDIQELYNNCAVYIQE